MSATAAEYGPYLAHALAPGEVIVEACVASLPLGSTVDSSRSPGRWRYVDAAVDRLSATNWLDRLLFGKAAGGPHDSIAGRLVFAGANVGGPVLPDTVGNLLAVTDQRLLWCGLTGPPLGDPVYTGAGPDRLGARPVPGDLVRLQHGVPRTEVAGARVGRHRLRAGRLWITFADASWVSFAGRRSRRAGLARLAAALSG